MYQQSKNENINTVGILSGLFLSFVPFYYFVRILSSLKHIKKGKKVAQSAVTLSFIALFASFIGPILLGVWIAAANNFEEGSSVVILIMAIVLFTILLLVTWIMQMVAGFQVKDGLNTNAYDSSTDQERYEVAKVAGAFLVWVPFYILVRVISDRDLVERMNVRTKPTGLMLVWFILALLGLIPYVSYITGIVQFIIAIVLGNQMNDVFNELKQEGYMGTNTQEFEDRYNTQSFDDRYAAYQNGMANTQETELENQGFESQENTEYQYESQNTLENQGFESQENTEYQNEPSNTTENQV